MKKLLSIAIAMLTCSMAMAIPAHPGTTNVAQPDGTMLTLRLVGDEFLHFNTTADGYTVVRCADGSYVYAMQDDDQQLVSSGRVAHDADARTADEQAWLSAVPRHLTPQMSATAARLQQQEMDMRAAARRKAADRRGVYDYNNFRGLIILVQFNDREFSRDDFPELFNDMVNKEDYTGYDNTSFGRYTGSVRDYFYDNSNGKFSPQFDIVGPVTVDYSQYDVNGFENAAAITKAAIDSVDAQVDFAQYDGDSDGTVDMVFFLFAGIGSHIGGNDEGLVWPHASSLYDPDTYSWLRRDNIWLGRYACSTELYGTNTWSILDGIGVISHEFSHVLGLEDLYDVDYEGSGGESPHPGDWCIMAGGGYLNYGRTPCGYSLYERYAIDFATPTLLDAEGTYTLPAIGDSNMGFRLNTPVNREFFLLENRQQTSKWDAYLPGHGMLVFRVDSTNTSVWRNNGVNNNPNHMYFELRRAGGGNAAVASSRDPFPGTDGVTTLNNVTTPASLLTWAGKATPFGLENIQETGGDITFDLVDVYVLKSVALPEQLTVGKGLTMQMEEVRTPDYAPYTLAWSSSNPDVATIDQNGLLTAIEVGQTTVTVVANDDATLSASCVVTVEEVASAADIAAFRQQDEGTKSALQLNDALVVLAKDDNAFVRDASGAIWLADISLGLETGDVLNGYIYGALALADGVPQLTADGSSTNASGFTVTKGGDVKPRERSLSDLTPADYADLVLIRGTHVERASGIWAYDDDHRVRLYNRLQIQGITAPTISKNTLYDVTGIYLTNTLGGAVIDEIQLAQPFVVSDLTEGISPIGTADASTPLTVYTADGRMVVRTTAGQLPQLSLPHGVYIVKGEGVSKTVVL